MFQAHDRWKQNEAEVAADIIEGEAIILNLANGLYYGLADLGASVWEQVIARRSVDEIAGSLVAAYAMPSDFVRGDVERLVAELLNEGLIVPSDANDRPTDEWPALQPNGRTYVRPELKKYTDMAEFLALDPPMPGLMDGPWGDSAGEP